jgi:predicted CXXCH cytochrome family protein
VAELDSPVYHTHVAATCAKCHSDCQLMKGRLFHGKPLPCDQYAKWRQSVHGKALMDQGDLSAPTCNNCHGNHGAVPPQVDTVANACGVCHGKIAKLFEQARMKHQFEEVGLPGCATCHGSHGIMRPSDEMLGMADGAVCARCHGKGKFGATLAGAKTARTLRSDLERLKSSIHTAEETLDTAERLGMEVSQPRFELRTAVDDLTNARSLVHTFHLQPVETALAGGAKVVSEVQQKAEHALEEHTARRIWLAASLVPIVLVIVLLVLYIRTLPAPRQGHQELNE